MADADLRPIPYLGTSRVTAEPVKTGTVRQFRRPAGRSPVGCRAESAGGHQLVPSAVATLVELAGHAGEADLGCIWSPPSTISSQSSLLILTTRGRRRDHQSGSSCLPRYGRLLVRLTWRARSAFPHDTGQGLEEADTRSPQRLHNITPRGEWTRG
jgi:hypothetical protein